MLIVVMYMDVHYITLSTLRCLAFFIINMGEKSLWLILGESLA